MQSAVASVVGLYNLLTCLRLTSKGSRVSLEFYMVLLAFVPDVPTASASIVMCDGRGYVVWCLPDGIPGKNDRQGLWKRREGMGHEDAFVLRVFS